MLINCSELFSIDNSTTDATDATAVAGTDYASASGTIFFEYQQAVADIEITVINDEIAESTEIFFVVLSNPINTQVSGSDQLVITIDDDDEKTSSSSGGGANSIYGLLMLFSVLVLVRRLKVRQLKNQ
ncbi:MAG: hypothetical protein KUG78_15295 [Kangiellaceae bacterium]|nr:hypothetical protein [Kangiellaceae bacterium]